jgi:hypothetical protein
LRNHLLRLTVALIGPLASTACLDQVTELVPVPRETPDSGFITRPPTADAGSDCHLGFSPPSLDFGNVIVGSTVTDQIGLWNDGGGACAIAGLVLGSGSDPDFSLPATQLTAFVLQPGASTSVQVSFDATDDALPHLRTGSLNLKSNDSTDQTPTVPLSAYINEACSPASQLIYLVDGFGRLSSFDPTTLVFNDIGLISCPFPQGPQTPGWTRPEPFSMNVDQNAVAWVLFTDGELFRVDTASAACTATDFQVDQQSFNLFGMGSVFQSSTGIDTLYIAGGPDYFSAAMPHVQLGTIAFPSLSVSTIGPLPMGWAELAGTGDGQLWGFVPAGHLSATGIATLAQIDPATGDTLLSYELDGMSAGGGFAMKFYGGSFWIFLGTKVYQVQRADGLVVATLDTGRDVVGAGVSTCAPVQ